MNQPQTTLCIRVLHLEDDPLHSERLKTELETRNIPCSITRVWTRDAFDAALNHGQLNVIVSDWKMDERASTFDSLAALAQAKQRHPALPFIFFAELPSPRTKAEAFRHGASDFISKSDVAKLARIMNGLFFSRKEKPPRTSPEMDAS